MNEENEEVCGFFRGSRIYWENHSRVPTNHTPRP